MHSEPSISLSEKDYLAILDLIRQLNSCETIKNVLSLFEKTLLPLVGAQAGLIAHVEPEVANCQVMETVNISPSTIETFQKLVPNNQLSIEASSINRPVVAYGVDRDRKELDEEISSFLIKNPQYKSADLSYFHKLSSVLAAVDRPDSNIGIGIHRLKPYNQPFTLREVRIVELLRPHLCHTMKTLVLSRQLAQYKSLAEETLDNASSAMALINKNFWIVYQNKMFEALFPLQSGQSLPLDLVKLIEKEIARHVPPYNVEDSQVELAFYTLPQGKFRLGVTVLKGAEEDRSLLIQLKPVIEAYAKMNGLLQEKELTGREMEVCILVKDGIANQEISSRLFISPHTTKNHIKSIHKKLDVNTRAQLVAFLNQSPLE